ncbi:hypothetical protein [Microcoleus sp. FACHB-672]|uniref:hypothetical protein n=1 Tax=Microcoleus sp. FACHB-672 TaxID=2692825 RepID=UPI0016839FFD|nr:hypothetical protein [Microcoleus sp. FACHB-672]MBD2043085.1 hypothetical protein [Microcoleus sp. FACHB-672]
MPDQVTVVLPINQISPTFAEVSLKSVCEREGIGGVGVGCGVEAQRLQEMLPPQGVGMKCDPIRLCGVCYAGLPCHRIKWQFYRQM